MQSYRFARSAVIGIAAAVTLSAVAGATPLRVYDPTQHTFVTYDQEVDHNRPLDPKFQAQVVPYATEEAPGTVIVDTTNKFLYYVLADDMAIRYGVGVGREGFGWTGTVEVGAKQEWPTWTPPAEMVERRPELVEYSDGMPGGVDNPLGARALYLYDHGRDTMFRIHGTNAPWSIGENMSSGCIRMLNEQITELYQFVHVGTKVIVM